MAKSKKIRFSYLKIALVLFLVLFFPLVIYSVKKQTRTESNANAYCQASVYVTPFKNHVEFNDTKTSYYYVYVTQTKDHACTYDLRVSNLPRGVSAYIQSQITPAPHSSKYAVLRVKHDARASSGVNDIYIKVLLIPKGDADTQTQAVGHAEYIIHERPRGGDN